MMMRKECFSDFQIPVRGDIIREINKRGLRVQRKDAAGNVVKTTNEAGPTSAFGWGTVEDTVPALKKDLDHLRKHWDEVMQQIPLSEDSILENLFPPDSPAEEADALRDWYEQWHKKNMDFAEFMATPTGGSLSDFHRYLATQRRL